MSPRGVTRLYTLLILSTGIIYRGGGSVGALEIKQTNRQSRRWNDMFCQETGC